MEDLLDMNNSSLINTGQPTYQHHDGSRSHLDVSIVSDCLAAKSNWGVLNNTLGSDHCPTVMSINERQSFTGQLGPPKFKLSTADWCRFKGICNEKLSAAAMHDDTIHTRAQQVMQAIVSAAEACIPQSKPSCKIKHAPLPYWNKDCKNAIYERNRARN